MHQLTSTHPTPLQQPHGIALIESLVAIVVMALGILGILGVQMRTLTDTQTSVRRAQAIRLIEDLSERMKVHPNALNNLASYVSAFDNTPTPGNCTNGCSAAQQASYDLAIWKQTVANSLPLGQASIFLAPGETQDANRRQLGVIISWRENEREGTKTDDIDATKVRAADGSFTAGTDTTNACPADRTCHLQYLPVSARCAPYDNGSGTKVFYCS
ncbi:MAG: type IV pilus modification protein PilV [Simplicispira sp.]|nr:type IV pilus modification protein PilV [Simplicispira sp.]